MGTEFEIFKKYTPDYDKIIKYGFVLNNGIYVFEKLFKDNEFKAVITIVKSGEVFGAVYDMETGDEFLPLRVENPQGAFIGEVREEYKKLLIEIRENCFSKNYFIFPQTNRISKVMIEKYGNNPVFMWDKFPNYGVFKNPQNNKWYAMIGDIKYSKLDKFQKDEIVEIMNIKIDAEEIQMLHKMDGFYPAYHMNKKTWITLVLNDTLTDKKILDLVAESYTYAKSR